MASRDLLDESPNVVYPAIVDRWAVVVGISKYKDKGVRNLEFAANDAADMAASLQTAAGGAYPPENVRLLIDGDATSAEIFAPCAAS